MIWKVFSNDLTKQNIEICNGLTCVTNEFGHKYLIGVKEAPYLPNNTHSLLSINQVREARTWVGDKCPIEYWLDDPKNKGKYDKIIDPNNLSSNIDNKRERIMEEEVDTIMNNKDDTTIMDEFQGILQNKGNIGAELSTDDDSITSPLMPQTMKEKYSVAAVVVVPQEEEDMPFPQPV